MVKTVNKLTSNFQNTYIGKNLYDISVIEHIDKEVQVHGEATTNPLSSAAACLNVLGSMAQKSSDLLAYLKALELPVTKVIKFPTGANVGGRVYDDSGYVIFEWVGPQKSPILELGGKRGQYRTSIDAYILAEIDNKVTQLLIEWKFTEGNSRPLALERFSGLRGIERLRRYSTILAKMRKPHEFPFVFQEEGGIGLYDFSPDHLLQLLRMTLLAKTTTPVTINNIQVEDYRIVHLSHSQNDDINFLHDRYLTHSPGLKQFSGRKLHEVWKELLSQKEREKFIGAYWDKSLSAIPNENLRKYLMARYQP